MDIKSISPVKPLDLSGANLLVLLACTLGVWAIFFDWLNEGRASLAEFITFPFLICALTSGILGYWVVPLLRQLKTGQIIQEDGPQTHLKKAGTPTMGGIFFIPVAVIIAVFWTNFTLDAIAVSLVTLGYGFIGWFDDWQVLRRKSNKGISPKMKLTLQIAIALLFCVWLWWQKFPAIADVELPGGLVLKLGLLFFPLTGFVLAAESNATNLTDGVDGLAAGTSAIAFFGLGIIVAPSHPDLMLFCVCMSGACIGFLRHNHNRAQVFMGDTGSLALGGSLAAVGLLSGNLWALFVVSGIFFLESISVIAQVLYYKATKDAEGKGKRLLKMAPIHHHFELSGWSETQVVGSFYVANILLVVLAYFWR
ncbi:Phospho-N-acetylmuramoyl-pentapeptide-transferase [Xenococcus sp. PCC 7305]|uniref:phospho-N-acetylmuramoyl-pentapeptide- transferase n=1 Tax=Xenococcus sp. PCC 7305 TaxID=102125 RepID=UPI0002AC6176|nr:phospho-N-acetylmuramoyl-pentapeptide-transferase [Xenococcus sp. PCC 7305]ELS02426.1 Phospho-N-acetylmuramoyl-pentapeptide-transferase [Xenococcus sp. PCC 7305]